MVDFLSLPVYKHKSTILDALKDNQVIIVESPTGSGKTTQIPLILKEAGFDKEGIIGITQPRRIATLSVSEFIKKQIKDDSSYVAYTMRFDDTSTKDTRIKVMTDGILLQEIKASPLLNRYSVLMVDEAHERSLNIDFILGLIKEIISKRKDLKVIISSATINAASFSKFFDNAPIISIDGKPYPVEIKYIPLFLNRDNEDIYYEKIASIVKERIEDKDGGDILIFLPGEAEIKACIDTLETTPFKDKLQIYPLYGRLSKEEQEEVFTPREKGKRKVIVSTNIAETSITIDGIRTVIDSGLSKVNHYNQKNYTSALIPQSISRASANQRTGRAGRTAPGVCYRLYSQENFEKRPEYTEEEILHSDLAEVVLRMSELGIYNTQSFPFITPPMSQALKSAEETLILIKAINEDHSLTKIGEEMIKFPLLPRLSRVIVEAMFNYPEQLPSVITAVSYLSTKSPFVLPPGKELNARDAHKRLSDKIYGDFLTMLKLYTSYTSISKLEDRKAFCTSNYLDFQTMEEIVHIKGQLEEILTKQNFPLIDNFKISDYFCCLASGLRQYVCKNYDKYYYRSLTARDISIHPGSAWFRALPEYILAGEIVRTSKTFARTVSPLRYEWLSQIDPFLPEALNKLEKVKKQKVKGQKDKKEANTPILEKYAKVQNGKKIYIIPFDDIKLFKSKSNTKVYIKIGKLTTNRPISLSRVDKEISLIKVLKGNIPSKTPKIHAKIKDYDSIKYLLNHIYQAIEYNKKLGFLGLVESKGTFSLRPYATIQGAVKESLYALSEIVDLLPEEKEELRKRAYKTLALSVEAADYEEL